MKILLILLLTSCSNVIYCDRYQYVDGVNGRLILVKICGPENEVKDEHSQSF